MSVVARQAQLPLLSWKFGMKLGCCMRLRLSQGGFPERGGGWCNYTFYILD